MKIAIPAQGNSLDMMVDERFGRAKGFIIFDTQTDTFQWIDNDKNMNASSGAGTKTAQAIIDANVQVLITNDVGPKAYQLLSGEGIEIFKIEEKMTVKDAITKFKQK